MIVGLLVVAVITAVIQTIRANYWREEAKLLQLVLNRLDEDAGNEDRWNAS